MKPPPLELLPAEPTARKSKGPKTLQGKARVSLNALKTGAFAKTDKARREIFDRLDLLEKWVRERQCPDEYPQTMREPYGECPSLAGEKIRLLIIDCFGDDEAAMHKACEDLPKWLGQERSDVQRERELHQREMTIKGNAGPNLTEEEVAKKEAALERQIGEHAALAAIEDQAAALGAPEAPGPSWVTAGVAPAPCSSSGPSSRPSGGHSFAQNDESISETVTTEHEILVNETVAAENDKEGQSNLVSAA